LAQVPRNLVPTRSPLHYFGAELRRRRQDQGLSQADLGHAICYSKDLVRRVESAERLPSREFVVACDATLGANGALLHLWPMLEREHRLRTGTEPAFRSDLLDRPVLDWLLATFDTSKRLHAPDDDVVEAVETLSLLRDRDHARGAGATYPAVRQFVECSLDPLAVKAPQVATGFLELAGYDAVDLGADGLAQRYYLHALRIATAAGDGIYGGYLIAVSLAHLALHCGDPDQTMRLATAAIHGAGQRACPAVRATFRLVQARAHARSGDEAACAGSLRQAEADLARRDPADEPDWIAYFGEADLADEKAHCFFDLGRHESAKHEATAALRLLAPNRTRRRAIEAALLASSLARAGEIEEACAAGRQAVDYAAQTMSFRGAHRIALMMAELHGHADQRCVRELAGYASATLPATVTLTSAPPNQ
jgi:transcriptional regulator with XRE-family HTH domain